MVRYFAYGSNMNPARIAARCPEARRLGTATLKGWKVAERMYADIERRRGGVVRGVVYELTNRDYAALDRYEGCPNVYQVQRVRPWVDGQGWTDCVAYILTPRARRERDGVPYPDGYRAICSEGAKANGIADAFAAA